MVAGTKNKETDKQDIYYECPMYFTGERKSDEVIRRIPNCNQGHRLNGDFNILECMWNYLNDNRYKFTGFEVEEEVIQRLGHYPFVMN